MLRAQILLVGVITGSAQAVELTDYIVPNSFYEAAYISGALNAASSTEGDQAQYNSNLQANYEQRRSTLPVSWQLSVDTFGSAKRGSTEGDEQESQYQLDLGASYDRYFNAQDPLFWTAGVDFSSAGGSAAVSQSDADLNLGIGRGRIFDATPLARVLRIQEELQRYELIEAEIADDLLLEMAKVVAKEAEYRSEYQATQVEGTDKGYQAYIVADLEAILNREKLLVGNSLGAVGALRIAEVLFDESVSPRKHGWVARAGLAVSRNETDGVVEESDPALSLDFEYAQPYGYRGQLTNTARFVPSSDRTRVSNSLSYTYEVTDTIDWENTWDWRLVDNELGSDSTHTLSSRYVVQVTESLNYTLGMELSRRDGFDEDKNEIERADSALTMSLRYRLR